MAVVKDDAKKHILRSASQSGGKYAPFKLRREKWWGTGAATSVGGVDLTVQETLHVTYGQEMLSVH